MKDKCVVEKYPAVLWKQAFQIALHVVGIGRFGEPQPPGKPPDVCIYCDSGPSKSVGEHHRRRFAPDTGQAQYGVEIFRYRAAEAFGQRRGGRHAVFGLGTVQTDAFNQWFDLVRRRLGHRRRVRVTGKKRRGRGVDAFVGRLCGQNGRDQQLEGVAVAKFGFGVGVGGLQRCKDELNAPLFRTGRGSHAPILTGCDQG